MRLNLRRKKRNNRQKTENLGKGFIELSLWVKSKLVFNVNVNTIRQQGVKELFLKLEVGSDGRSVDEVCGSDLQGTKENSACFWC